MPPVYKVATLLYCFDDHENVLLLRRAREPNRGLWSPPGGKVMQEIGESPYACACREANEELGVDIIPEDLHLTGLITEQGFSNSTHWLMFLFEVKPRLTEVPQPIEEGYFRFFSRAGLDLMDLPESDRDMIWPMFWKHRGGFFSANCRLGHDGYIYWTVEQSNPVFRDARRADY